MEKRFLYFLLILLLLSMHSCKRDRQRMYAQEILTEWIGKTIIYPMDVPLLSVTGDTIDSKEEFSPFKILLFTDSIGCTSCQLHLYKWNMLIDETDSLMSDKLSFQFYFHPKDIHELKFLFRRDDFQHPVFFDLNNQLSQMNNFPTEVNYQCFLLDKDNKVILVGNPVNNPAVWDLYKQVIKGESPTSTKQLQTKTLVEVKHSEIEMDDLKVGETKKVSFVLENIGTAPLLLWDVDSSCGCTIPKWDKNPIDVGKKTQIEVAVTSDSKGYFNKKVRVICNTKEGMIKLSIKGVVKS